VECRALWTAEWVQSNRLDKLAPPNLWLGCAPTDPACRRAKELVEQAAVEGRLGPHGAGARVIYAQTDSIFVLLPQVRQQVAGWR